MNLKSLAVGNVRRTRVVLLAVAGIVLAGATTAGAAVLVTGAGVVDGSLASRDVRDDSVKGLDVTDGSLSSADLSGDLTAIVGPAGARGPRGLPGPTGPIGPTGSAGSEGASGVPGYRIVGQEQKVPAKGTGYWHILCPEYLRPLGGGVWADEAPFGIRITTSAPHTYAWLAGVVNKGTTELLVTGFAVCGMPSDPAPPGIVATREHARAMLH